MRRVWLLTIAATLAVAGCGRRDGQVDESPGGLEPDWPPRTQPSSVPDTTLQVVVGTNVDTDATDPDRPPPSYIPTSAWVTAKPTKHTSGGGGSSAGTEPDGTDPSDTTDPGDTDPPSTDPGTGPTTTVPIGSNGSSWKAGILASDPQVTADEGACEPFFDALADAPYDVSECGTWQGAEGPLMWTVTRGDSGRLRALVWEQADEGSWFPRTRLDEPKPGGVWDGVTLVAADVDGDGDDELVAATHESTNDAQLSLDVLDITSHMPIVSAHISGIPHGRGVITAEGLVIYTAEAGAPPCCPVSYASYLLVFNAKTGYSAVLQDGGIAPDDLPASDL